MTVDLGHNPAQPGTIAGDKGARMGDIEDIARFVMAGRAVFTIVSKATGNRLTFKVDKSKQEEGFCAYFVKVKSGPEQGEWSYLGAITREGKFMLTKASRATTDAMSYKVFSWVWGRIINDAVTEWPTDKAEFWHVGRCCKCGRELTVPESIAQGIGPICIGKV